MLWSRRGLALGAWMLVGCPGDDGGTPAVEASSASSGASASDASDPTALGSSSAASGTSDSGASGAESLVTVEAWGRDDDPADPFGPRPEGTVCDFGFSVEGGLYEIDTEVCTWGTFVQPSLAPIVAGDTLEFIMVHDALYSEEAGVSAQLGVAVGADVVWQLEIPIPAEEAFRRPTFVAPADAPVGTPLRFHVHNHGANSYRLVDFTVTHR